MVVEEPEVAVEGDVEPAEEVVAESPEPPGDEATVVVEEPEVAVEAAEVEEEVREPSAEDAKTDLSA